jgi:hypothetical protein
MLDTSYEPLAKVPEGHSRAPRITSGAGAGIQLLQRITAPYPGSGQGAGGTPMNVLPHKPKPTEIILYQTEDGQTKIQVRLEDDTVWLTQSQMAELFQTSIPNVSIHIRNIFREGELRENSVVKDFLTTAADGKRYRTNDFNLDVIISVGYRIKSHRGTQFRIWATQRLRQSEINEASKPEGRSQ